MIKARTPLDQHGAIIVQVAVSLLVLMSFMVFVVDYGVLWVARGQAQNAADAGALSGAVGRAYDDASNPPPPNGVVEQSARLVAQQTLVWGQVGAVGIDYNCPPGVTGGGCVQVDVFRNSANGNALPVFFGPLLNINNQGIQATATAQALPANAANCLKPWVVFDRWDDAQDNPWTQASIYTLGQGDSYIAPYGGAPTTGFSNRAANGNPVDYGYQMVLKMSNPQPQNPQVAQWGAGWAMIVDLPNGTNVGAAAVAANITGCTSATVAIAAQGQQCLAPNPTIGCLQVQPGSLMGPNVNSVGTLISSDGTASWNRSANGGLGAIVGSTAASGISPRIVPIAVVDPDHYIRQPNVNGNNGIVKIVNILGFFLEGVCSNSGRGGGGGPGFFIESYLGGNGQCSNGDIVGRLVSFPGTLAAAGQAAGPGNFGQVIRLVR